MKKTLPIRRVINQCPVRMGCETRRRSQASVRASYILRLEALGALQALKLHVVTFVQCPVAVLLDSGEVDEDVLARDLLTRSAELNPLQSCRIRPGGNDAGLLRDGGAIGFRNGSGEGVGTGG